MNKNDPTEKIYRKNIDWSKYLNGKVQYKKRNAKIFRDDLNKYLLCELLYEVTSLTNRQN